MPSTASALAPPSPALEGLLARSPWYVALDAGAQTWVTSRLVESVVPRDQFAARRGEIPACWFGVIDGLLKSSVVGADGRASSLGGILPGCWFGEGALMRGQPRHADFVALRESRLAVLRLDDFSQLMQTQVAFKDFILAQVNERLHFFMEHVGDARHLRADAQVAHALCGLLHPLNNPWGLRQLRISQDELAAIAGVSRQRCNQALAQMRARGWLDIAYGGLTLLAPASIERMARDG